MKVGTIGSGSIVEKIIENMHKTASLRCVAVYSRTEEKGSVLADKFGVKKVYTDLEMMMSDPDIDIIYVASPNSLHYIHTKMALEHGKHVLCEKPMTPYVKQTEELYALAKEKNLLLFEAMTIAHAPNYKVMKRHLPDVGRVRLVLLSYSQYSSRYDQLRNDEVTNVFNPDFAGGALMDINVYNIYTVVGLFGRPTGVHYYPNCYKNGVDTSGILVLTYPDFVCQCTGSKDAHGENSVQIQGDDGYICALGSINANPPVHIVTRDKDILVDEQPDGHQWYYEMQSFERLFNDKGAALALMEAERIKTLDCTWILEEARKSAGMPF